MPTNIAEVVTITALPRSPGFAEELDHGIHVLIPSCMSRIGDPALRDPILISCSHLDGHIRRLLQALETGEPDSFEIERHLHGYWLMKSAVEHWRDAPAGVRFPAEERAE